MLRELELKPVYDSAEYDLIEDLIVPLLKQSKHYRRGVRFFTSGWLKLAAQGIKELVENGGLAQIVLSPIIEEKDWKAFQLGEEARENESIKKIIDQHITDLADSLEHDTLNALAWMISDGCLEFKFAVARDNINSNYHDKVAVYTDERGEMVAIHGSERVTLDINLEEQLRNQLKELIERIYKRTDKYSAKEIEDNITVAFSEVQETYCAKKSFSF